MSSVSHSPWPQTCA